MTRSRIALPFTVALALVAAEMAPDVFDLDPKLVAQPFQAFGDDVNVRWDQDFVYIESDSMPRHQMMVGIRSWNRQVPIPQPYFGDNAFRLPLRPRLARDPISCKETLFRGAIAVAANGVPIFNPIKQDGRTDTHLAGELDEFGGHAGRADDYHYHVAPVHLADQLPAGLPIARALDGFAMYGYEEGDGSKPKDLDWLNGHAHSGSLYHYHATQDYPYVNGGMRGDIEVLDGQVAGQPRAGGVRPFTRPLRGATITGFENPITGSFRLEYVLNGRTESVDYRIQPHGEVEFVFTNGMGQSHTEVHAPRANRGGRRPRSEASRPRRRR